MKRFSALFFVVFWSLGIFFSIRFFSNLRSSYSSKAFVAGNSILRILPNLSDSGQALSAAEIKQIVSRYSGLIVRTDDLDSVKALSRSLRAGNPEFKLYLQFSLSQLQNERLAYATARQNKDWLLMGKTIDIRDPLYRQAFFNYWIDQIKETKANGVYLTDVNPCPPGVTKVVCQTQYSWWEMSVMDFMAQIRQYFSEQTILIEGSPIINNQEKFTKKILQQADGIMFTDFGSIYNDENTFFRYYHFIVSLLKEPQYLEKQLVFSITADPSLQHFFQASYLLFANRYSSYYFTSDETKSLSWYMEWEQEYLPSLNSVVKAQSGIYERELPNALVLVNPGIYNQTIFLNQKILQTNIGRLWQDKPIKFQDSLSVPGKSGQIVNLLFQNDLAPTDFPTRIAEWSDKNSSAYSDFENQYLLRETDSLLLGNLVSTESFPKNYDDRDDGLQIDGLEAGIFNLNRGQTYFVQVSLSNLITNSGQLEVWVDWDGKGNLPPALVFNQANSVTAQLGFDLMIPDYATDYVFVRAIVKDQDQGEVEDYLLKVQ